MEFSPLLSTMNHVFGPWANRSIMTLPSSGPNFCPCRERMFLPASASFTCSNGLLSPFVGPSLFRRWVFAKDPSVLQATASARQLDWG